MYACDYLETGFLNVLRGVTFAAPTKVYLALFLNDPGDSGAAGTEISYAGYARMEIAFSEPAVSNGGIGIQNLSDITFAAPADPAGTVTHIAIMDSLVGGNMLARSELTESLVIGANEPPVFLAGDVLFYLTGNMSNAFKTKLLNLFRGTSILGMRIVNKIVAKVRVGSFRAYSKATKAAESKVVSSTTASQKTYSSTSGGGSTSTTSSGGGQTSGATTLESSNVLPSQTSGQAVHNHGLSRGARLATTSDGQTIDGYETFVWSGAHVHPAHTHEIDDHSHSVRIPSHSHNVTIPGHSHNITIPAHEHDITPGIYFYGSPKQFDLYVNGKKKTTIVSTDTELDLTQYLVDTSSKLIPRGSWLSIEIRPNDLAYVSIDMFVQGFVQSRGDATV